MQILCPFSLSFISDIALLFPPIQIQFVGSLNFLGVGFNCVGN